MSERFVSKRDGWLVAVLWAASLVDFGVAAWLWTGQRGAPAFVAPLLLAAGVFQLHVLYATDYTLEGDTLRIRASFFRWRVPLAAIESIEPTRNPALEPGLLARPPADPLRRQAHHDLARRQGHLPARPPTNRPPQPPRRPGTVLRFSAFSDRRGANPRIGESKHRPRLLLAGRAREARRALLPVRGEALGGVRAAEAENS